MLLLALTTWIIALEVLGFGIAIGYHRLLTHNAFKAHPVVRNALTLAGALYGGSPLLWVGVHRVHHTVTDWLSDPHTPKRGFWFAHCGWIIDSDRPLPCVLFALSGFGLQARFLYWDVLRLLGKRDNPVAKMVRDLQREPFMRWLDRPLVISGLFALQLTAAISIAGVPGLVWLWSLHLAANNLTWAINSFCHLPAFGDAPHKTKDQSRNVRWLNVVTNGESSHNAHHSHPRSANFALNGEWDLSYQVIRLLARLGLASDIRVADPVGSSLPPAIGVATFEQSAGK